MIKVLGIPLFVGTIALGSAFLLRLSNIPGAISLFLVPLILFLLLLLTAGFGLASACNGKTRGGNLDGYGYIGYTAFVCFAGILMFLKFKMMFFLQSVRPVQDYAVSLVPKLNEYHRWHGSYPAKLTDAGIGVPARSPYTLLRYTSHGDWYSFTLWDGLLSEYGLSDNGLGWNHLIK